MSRRSASVERGYTTTSPECHSISTTTPSPTGDSSVSMEAGIAPIHVSEKVSAGADRRRDVVFDVDGLSVSYGTQLALHRVSMQIYRNQVTAIIGPSGCGKSTFIRCFNRMNDLIPGAEVHGQVLYHGEDLYGPDVDPVEARRLIGMVFQKPNPFPKSIYDNVAYGPRVLGMKSKL